MELYHKDIREYKKQSSNAKNTKHNTKVNHLRKIKEPIQCVTKNKPFSGFWNRFNNFTKTQLNINKKEVLSKN